MCDYVSHFFLYMLLGLGPLLDQIGGWAIPIGILAGVSRIIQSNHGESQRRTYLWRVYGIPWLQHAEAKNDGLFGDRGAFARTFAPVARGYVQLADMLTPASAAIGEAAARSAASPRDLARFRRLCRAGSGSALRLQIWLGSNPRTIILGLSMAAGSPLYYFIVEIVLGNALLIWSVAAQKRCDARLEARLQAPGIREER